VFLEDVSADGEFPTKGSPVCFGAAITDEVKLKLFATFEELLWTVKLLTIVERWSEA
jgi:hypothetical protein